MLSIFLSVAWTLWQSMGFICLNMSRYLKRERGRRSVWGRLSPGIHVIWWLLPLGLSTVTCPAESFAVNLHGDFLESAAHAHFLRWIWTMECVIPGYSILPGYLILFSLLDPQSYTRITQITFQRSPYTLVRGLFPSVSSLHFTNTCNLIVVCSVFGAGTFFKPRSPSSTSLPAHTHHLPFLGLFGFMKMSSFILSRQTSLIQVDTALN